MCVAIPILLYLTRGECGGRLRGGRGGRLRGGRGGRLRGGRGGFLCLVLPTFFFRIVFFLGLHLANPALVLLVLYAPYLHRDS